MLESIIIAPMLLLLSAFGETGNEVLDVVDSPSYWKVAGIEYKADSLIPLIEDKKEPVPDLSALEDLVEDLDSPEFVERQKAAAALAKAGSEARPVLEKAAKSDNAGIATAATQILSKLGRDASDSRLHRLMAIRGLGELKAAAAAPHIEKLTTSTEPFIADYAARSLAGIRGEKYVGKKPDPLAFKKDLEITYPSAAAVFHVQTAPRDGDVGVRAMIEQGMALMGGIGAMGGEPEPGDMPDMDEMLTEMTKGLVGVFQRIGNVRIDSVTGVLPSDVTPRSGGFVLTARGLYDHKRALDFLKEEAIPLKTTRIGDFEWYGVGNDVYLHFASDELFVMVVGEDVEKYAKAVSARLSGDNKIPAGGPAIELAKGIPVSAMGFFAAEVPEAMAEGEEALAIFKTVVAHMGPTGDEGEIGFKVRLRGTKEKPVADLFTQMQMGIAMGKGAVAAMAKSEKKLADLAEMMDSVKIERDGGTRITGEADMPSASSMPLGAVFGGFFLLKPRSVDMAPIPDAKVEGIEVAPPEIRAVPLEKSPDEAVPVKP